MGLEITIAGKRYTIGEEPEGGFLPLTGNDEIRQIPAQAIVAITPSTDGWGGILGVTYFVQQVPLPELYNLQKGWLESGGLFAGSAKIYPEGHDPAYYPPELPEMIECAEERLGYQVDPAVKRVMLEAMARPTPPMQQES